MTNQEAIKELSEWLDGCCGDEEIEPTRQALRLAISALRAQEELYVYSQCKTCRYFHDYDVRCMIYDDYDVRCMICDDENDMYEAQEVKKSGCTYKPDCPWYDGSKCNSPNDHRYHECDYDRGILPEDDSDELDEVMQHWIKQADEQEKVAEMYPEYADECKKISNDFRQLASWIRELKRLRTEVYFLKTERENTPVDLLGDVSCKTCRWKAETRGYVKGQLDAINDLVAAGLIERGKAFSMLKDHDLDEAGKDTISRQEAIEAVINRDANCGIDSAEVLKSLPSAQPETAKRIVGKSRDGMTLWYQCDMCNEPVDAQDDFCRGCGRRLTDE